jgi:hypothetical protein
MIEEDALEGKTSSFVLFNLLGPNVSSNKGINHHNAILKTRVS